MGTVNRLPADTNGKGGKTLQDYRLILAQLQAVTEGRGGKQATELIVQYISPIRAELQRIVSDLNLSEEEPLPPQDCEKIDRDIYGATRWIGAILPSDN